MALPATSRRGFLRALALAPALLLLSAWLAVAALPATAVWEVRTTGVSTSGGAFDPSVTSPGTDFSQQDAPQVSYTDLVIGATTTQLTSAANPFTSAHVGNTIQVASGTGFTVGYYNVRSVAGSTATMDRSVGTAASSGGVGKLGGAMDHPATAGASYVASNTIYIKSGTYLHGSTANGSGNRLNAAVPLTILGYTTTRTDDGPTRPIMQANASTITIWTIANAGTSFCQVRNIDFYRDPAGGQTAVGGLSIGQMATVERCRVRNANNTSTTGGFATSSQGCTFRDCQADACVGGFGTSGANTAYVRCTATSCTTTGFANNSAGASYHRCVAASCAIGFNLATGGSAVSHCTSYGGSGQGFAGTGTGIVRAYRCLASANTGTGFTGSMRMVECAGYSNGAGGTTHYDNAGGAGVDNFVTLTADPFVNAAGLNFSPNTTAGGGAALRGVADTPPGLAGVDYSDIGAYQHADPTGGVIINRVP